MNNAGRHGVVANEGGRSAPHRRLPIPHAAVFAHNPHRQSSTRLAITDATNHTATIDGIRIDAAVVETI